MARGIGYKKHSIHKWSKEPGPSRQLLDKWNRNEIAWGDYVTQYSAEQMCSFVAKIEIDSIAKMSIHKTVTLLCKERENDPHCHSHVLKNIVNGIANKVEREDHFAKINLQCCCLPHFLSRLSRRSYEAATNSQAF
jgi:uncharacterized protein YeaO (DUF488 family)